LLTHVRPVSHVTPAAKETVCFHRLSTKTSRHYYIKIQECKRTEPISIISVSN